MTRTTLILLVLSVMVQLSAAQVPVGDKLLFTTRNPERTLAPKPPSLRSIDPNDVMCVRPPTAAGPVANGADKWAPANAWCTLIGDENANGAIWEALFAGGQVDALLWTIKTDYPLIPSMRDMYISPRSQIGSSVSGVFADPGDVFRVRANGQFVKFLTETQVRNAFGITSRTVNVDAVTLAKHPQLGLMIYLSLENTHAITVVNGGPMIAQDGAVLGLRVAGLGEPVMLAPNPAYMVLTEPMVDAMVVASGVRNASGFPITVVGDTDGLHPDPEGLLFQNPFGVWNNLWFSGEQLTGGAVLSTAGGGSIAVLNGAPLASNVATTGVQVGLLPSPGAAVGGLNGLEVREAEQAQNFVLETPLPVIPAAGGMLQVDVGGAVPAPGMVFLLAGAVPPATPIVPFLPIAAPISCFPELLSPATWIVPPGVIAIPINPQGEGSFVIGPVPPLGADLYFQAYNWCPFSATVRLSTPITVE